MFNITLFCYPFSAWAFSRIQAQFSSNRGSIEEPSFVRDFSLVEEIDQYTFWGSNLVGDQAKSLKQIQHLMKTYNLQQKNPNSITVRFTLASLNLCLLILNNSIFYDTYILAKEKRSSARLFLKTPITEIDREGNQLLFSAFEDHFRYLWTLDTTLYCEDATTFDEKKLEGLDRCKPPELVNFDQKANHIIYRKKEKDPNYEVNEDQINNWKFRLKFLLDKFTQEIKVSPVNESLFITCSWEKQNNGSILPNKLARDIYQWINEDFCSDIENYPISVNILQASLGEFLSQKLYKTLNESTLSVVIMTRDYQDKNGDWYSKPNIYHELGYLMKHLQGTTRVLVLRESKVILPSNIGNLVRKDFERENFDECYYDLLEWIKETSSYMPSKKIEEAYKKHKLRK